MVPSPLKMVQGARSKGALPGGGSGAARAGRPGVVWRWERCLQPVIPAKAGIAWGVGNVGPRFRGGDSLNPGLRAGDRGE